MEIFKFIIIIATKLKFGNNFKMIFLSRSSNNSYDGFLLFTLEIVKFHLWKDPKLWALCLNWYIRLMTSWGPSEGQEESILPPCGSSVSLLHRRPYENASSSADTSPQEKFLPHLGIFSPLPCGCSSCFFPLLFSPTGITHHVSHRTHFWSWLFPFKFCFPTWKQMERGIKKKDIDIFFCLPTVWWGF